MVADGARKICTFFFEKNDDLVLKFLERVLEEGAIFEKNDLIFEHLLEEFIWLLNEELLGEHGVLDVAVLLEEVPDNCFLVPEEAEWREGSADDLAFDFLLRDEIFDDILQEFLVDLRVLRQQIQWSRFRRCTEESSELGSRELLERRRAELLSGQENAVDNAGFDAHFDLWL